MRKLLPILGSHPGGRSAMTCRYRCGDACFHDAPNTSGNEYAGDIIASALSRRTMLRAGAVAGVVAVAGTGACSAESAGAATADAEKVKGKPAKGLRFTPVEPNTHDKVTIPEGYEQNVVIRWGEPILRGAPDFDPEKQTAKAQETQFGYNNDFLALVPLDDDEDGGGRHGSRRQLMVANHEYTDEVLMFAGYDADDPTREQAEIGWAAHGLSVVVVEGEKGSGALKAVPRHRLNRRVTATTPFQVTGPAAGSRWLRTSADPEGRTVLGTLNNCSGGTTPWGTTLHGEENVDQYFANTEKVKDDEHRKRLERYALKGTDTERKWERFDDRFDVTKEPYEPHRFGWVVELDPYDPDSAPRKRTALGRLKHEAAQPRLTRDGHAVVYMGDDEHFEYLYKFVSSKKMRRGKSREAHEHNLTLLDDGTLYVAKLTGDSPPDEIDGSGKLPSDDHEFDGHGKWIPLATGDRSHVKGMTADEVYVFTRIAGDKAGATKMDRPEDVEASPRSGRVYAALTNNTDRGASGKPGPDEANPRKGNKHGQILEFAEKGDDPAAHSFTWRLFLVCGDPDDPGTYFGGFPKDQVSPISCPDNVAFDPYGNLWLSTDGNELGSHDGLFGVATTGRRRGEVRQFLTVPTGAETCGPIIQEQRVLVAVQHPGEVDGASVEEPASEWPDGPDAYVRPAVVSVWPADGGNIGV